MNTPSLRLVQLFHPEYKRRVALVNEPNLILLENISSVYQLALTGIDTGKKLREVIENNLSAELLDYTSIYDDSSEWKLLPSFDHP